jgi:hypothetical protein
VLHSLPTKGAPRDDRAVQFVRMKPWPDAPVTPTDTSARYSIAAPVHMLRSSSFSPSEYPAPSPSVSATSVSDEGIDDD